MTTGTINQTETLSQERVRVLSNRTEPQARALLAGLAMLDRALARPTYRSEASAVRNGERIEGDES